MKENTTAAGAPSTDKSRRLNWPRIFGYDFFVSFKLGPPPVGAQSYASDLAHRLRELDFAVFFSEEEAPPGEKLDTDHRLARSANTDEALQTEYLRFSQLVFLRENPEAINSVAFSPDGARIVSGSYDQTLRLWDAQTGQPLGPSLKGYEDWVTSVAFSPARTAPHRLRQWRPHPAPLGRVRRLGGFVVQQVRPQHESQGMARLDVAGYRLRRTVPEPANSAG